MRRFDIVLVFVVFIRASWYFKFKLSKMMGMHDAFGNKSAKINSFLFFRFLWREEEKKEFREGEHDNRLWYIHIRIFFLEIRSMEWSKQVHQYEKITQYVADWILYKIYSEIHKEVLLLQFIARLTILLTLQQLYKTLSKQCYWSPQERCSLIKRFYIVIDWNSMGLHRVNSPVGIIHTVSTTPRRKDEVAMIR